MTDSAIVIFDAGSEGAPVLFETATAEDTFACDDPVATFEPILLPIRKAMDEFIPGSSVQTKDGRKEIARFARDIVSSKTMLEKIGKGIVDDLKSKPKKVDASRRYLQTKLDEWRDEVRAPLDEWEQREKDRTDRHEAAVERVSVLAKISFNDGRPLDSTQLHENLAAVQAVEVGPQCEEYEDAYRAAKEKAIEALNGAIAAREQYEREQAELANLRAENEERKAKEEAERVYKENVAREAKIAEEAASREREKVLQEAKRREEEAAAREAHLIREKEDAERRAADAAEKALRDAELAKAREEDDKRRREADTEHRASVNRAALQAFVDNGLVEGSAKIAITLIAKGLIPGITINY